MALSLLHRRLGKRGPCVPGSYAEARGPLEASGDDRRHDVLPPGTCHRDAGVHSAQRPRERPSGWRQPRMDCGRLPRRPGETDVPQLQRPAPDHVDLDLVRPRFVLHPEWDHIPREPSRCRKRRSDRVHRKAEVGIVIGQPSFWSRGYGTEAMRVVLRYGFDALGLNKISLDVLEYNTRALRTYERLGFQREGVHREDIYKDGRFVNVMRMSILARELRDEPHA